MRPVPADQDLFDSLAKAEGDEMATVIVPTHRSGRAVDQDRIRLKNGLATIDDQLESRGRKPREREERLSEARALLDDREFWEHQADSLAVFIDDEGVTTAVRLHGQVPELSVVMPVFHVRHLLGTVTRRPAVVLALTKDEVALFEVVDSEATRLDVELPNFEDANWFTDRETQRQQHQPVNDGAGRHGHDPSSLREHDTERFLRAVDDALPPSSPHEPLLVVGDDHLVAGLANVSERPISSPDNSGISRSITASQVIERVRPLLVDLQRDSRRAVAENAEAALGRGEATSDLNSALEGAHIGRVGKVALVDGAEPSWGKVSDEGTEISEHVEREKGDVDLLDRLVVAAARTGASIELIDEPISGSEFVAIHRF